MIVRLKEAIVISPFNALRIVFQFYDSPIKSLFCIIRFYARKVFQFYDSPIKSSVLQTLTNQDLAVSIL